jgi:hypothetical protein
VNSANCVLVVIRFEVDMVTHLKRTLFSVSVFMPLFILIIAVGRLCSFYNMKYAYKCNEMELRIGINLHNSRTHVQT